MTTDNSNVRKYLTVRQLREAHPFITEGGLRHWIFHASSNGFNSCIIRVGRKILVDEALFFVWLAEQGDATNPTAKALSRKTDPRDSSQMAVKTERPLFSMSPDNDESVSKAQSKGMQPQEASKFPFLNT